MIGAFHNGFGAHQLKLGIKAPCKGFVTTAGKAHAELLKSQFSVFLIIGTVCNVEKVGNIRSGYNDVP